MSVLDEHIARHRTIHTLSIELFKDVERVASNAYYRDRVAEEIFNCGLCRPSGLSLIYDQICSIAETIKRLI